MTGGTHITFGFLAATIEYKLTGRMDFSIPLFALAADIDSKESVASQCCSPLAIIVNKLSKIQFKGKKKGSTKRFIEKFLDHRYITHSWIPLAILGLLYINLGWYIFLSILKGWVSHLFADMLTVRGIPLFFPLSYECIGLKIVQTGSYAESVINAFIWLVIIYLLIPLQSWITLWNYCVELYWCFVRYLGI